MQGSTEYKGLASDSVCHNLIIALISIYPLRSFPQSLQERARLFLRQLYVADAGKKKIIFGTN